MGGRLYGETTRTLLGIWECVRGEVPVLVCGSRCGGTILAPARDPASGLKFLSACVSTARCTYQ
ncbi:hypothetical protein MPTK1_7g17070 [Marchantia polymorpha subsp. ruderalis]